MKIKKADREQIKDSLSTWAKTNKAKVKEQDQSFIVEKGSLRIEVIPEDGWAYVHSAGASTNISSMDEFGDAVKRLS